MTDGLLIRSATRADVPALFAMVRELAEYERLTHLCIATEAHLERGLFGPEANVEALVAMNGAEPAGFALYFHTFSTFLGRKGLYLEDLFVRPPHRHRGCGRALLTAVARIAAQRGCGRFEWMALDWNTPAIRFYEELGAKQMQEWRLFRVTGEALDEFANKR